MQNRTTSGVTQRPWVRVTALVLLAAAAAYQCFWRIAAENVGGDERTYVRAGLAYVHGSFDLNREHPPTAKYLFGLAQLVAGSGATGPRVLVSALVLVGAVVMFVWLRREVSFWAGYAAAALWTLTPRGGAGARIDRVALLDPVMTFFALVALFAIWMWLRTDRWWWLPLSAVLMAASVTSKVSTIVVLPAFLVAPMLFRRWRALVVGGLVWLGVFGVTVVALYAPMGMVSAVRYMLAFQAGQNAEGHLSVVNGTVYQFAPWWANAVFLQQSVGTGVLVVLVVGVLLAVAVRPGRLVVFLLVALAPLVVFYSFVSKIALPTYCTSWVPFLVLLAAIGAARLAELPPRRVTATLSTLLVLGALVASAPLARTVWETRPYGIARLVPLLRHDGVRSGNVLFAAISPSDYVEYVPTGSLRDVRDVVDAPFAAIVIGNDDRFPPAAEVEDLLRTERSSFERVRLDDIVVWVPDGEVVQDGAGLTVRR